MQRLIEALTAKGAGRMEIVTRTIDAHPEYFADDRVIGALITALGDRYQPMATLAYGLLQTLAMGECVRTSGDQTDLCAQDRLPRVDERQLVQRLKQGFDPKGKTEMTRRLILVSLLAGAAENDWYLSLLHTAKKEIRDAAIYALGYHTDNVPLLLELAGKDKTREMACRALAQCETPEAVAFWEKALEKDAACAEYLSTTSLDIYGDLAVKHLRAALETVLDMQKIPRQQFDETISPFLCALVGKGSAEVAGCYQWILEQRTRIPWIPEAKYRNTAQNSAMLSLVQEKLCDTLLLSCPKALVTFLQQGKGTELWEEACFLADIFTRSASEVYETWSENKNIVIQLWLQRIVRETPDTGGSFMVSGVWRASVFWAYETIRRPLKEPLDPRWIAVLKQEGLLY